jgi:quercetin dioxygenase-like cupin family protein
MLGSCFAVRCQGTRVLEAAGNHPPHEVPSGLEQACSSRYLPLSVGLIYGSETVTSWLRSLGIAAALLGSASCSGSVQANGQAAVPRVTELAGSRDRPGLFTQRLILPAHSCGPVHTHDQDLHGLVLRGALLMGIADSTGRIQVRAFSAGSFVVVPAGRPHVEGSNVETEVHLSGIGPLRTVVLDSASRRRCMPGDGT